MILAALTTILFARQFGTGLNDGAPGEPAVKFAAAMKKKSDRVFFCSQRLGPAPDHYLYTASSFGMLVGTTLSKTVDGYPLPLGAEAHRRIADVLSMIVSVCRITAAECAKGDDLHSLLNPFFALGNAESQILNFTKPRTSSFKQLRRDVTLASRVTSSFIDKWGKEFKHPQSFHPHPPSAEETREYTADLAKVRRIALADSDREYALARKV